MAKVDQFVLEEALKKITFPDLGNQNLMQLDIVKSLTCDEEGKVLCTIEVPPVQHHAFSEARKAAERVLKGIKGVRSATVVLTGTAKKPDPTLNNPPKDKLKELINLKHVRHVIAVASGKGGVGKSTVATNLAVTLSQLGHKVGLLDADIHGPSLPIMMGINEKPYSLDGQKMQPIIQHNIKCMSIGLLMPPDAPLTWRGPMVQSAVFQLLRDVNWATEEDPLDFLIMDLPPGTGDVHLTTCQSAPLTGAIIVTTPQDVALIDARRAHQMFEKLNIPVLGLVENMSVFHCPHCGEASHIFDQGGVTKEAKEYGFDILGTLPLDLELRLSGDQGTPLPLKDTNAPIAEAFQAIAVNLEQKINTLDKKKKAV